MPRHAARRAGLTAAVAAALAGLLSTGAAQADDVRQGQPATAAVRQPGGAAPVLLITGQRLLAGPGHAVAVIPAPAQAGGLLGLITAYNCQPGNAPAASSATAGAQPVRIPAVALPYLGRGLDPSLFSVGALEHAEHGGRLPVAISYRGRRPALPGITITSSGPGTARGYLTAASARRFGSALDRQFLADHGRGSYGTDGLFARGLSIALAGTRPTRVPPARPAYPMQTLTVRGTNLAGQPDTGDEVAVFNVDNCGKLDPFSSFNTLTHGTAKFSVPAGHYWAIGQFFGSATIRLAVLPQFTVRGDTTVAVSARSATSRISFTTPRPATVAESTFTLVREDHGAAEGISWIPIGGGLPLRVSPVSRPPAAGTLQAYTTGQLTSPAGQAVPYEYSLDFPAPPGIIPAALHYTARPASLATVRDRYYQDTRSTGMTVTFGGTPAELSLVGSASTGVALPLPGRQVQYLSASPPMVWSSGYDEFGATGDGGQEGAYQLFRAGQQASADWGRYPLHPAPNLALPGTAALGQAFSTLPTAARAANRLTVDITPFGDNQPGHSGAGYGGSCYLVRCAGRYALYQDGRMLVAGSAVRAAGPYQDLLVRARLSPRPARLTFVLTASRASRDFRLSAASRDVWTWPTRREPAATVPSPWFCGQTSGAYGQAVYQHRCAVQPMLMLDYQIARLSLSGSTRPGRQVIGIDVSHLALAAAARITAASLAVSFNGGRTWHAARVTRVAGGRFRAVFSVPAKTAITLRTHAADAAGSRLTETIFSAYRTA